MQCEKCGRETDIIKHIKIERDPTLPSADVVFYFNNYFDAMVCVECWNNAPNMKNVHEVEEIRNG